MCIFLYLYFEMKRLPRYPHLSPLQHEIEPPLSSFLLYLAFLAKERNLMHRNLPLRVSYLLQRAATHLLRIFKGTFFTMEKDTTKSLGLRRIKTSANGGTKWRQISKIAFGRIKNFFSGNVIALCVDSDEKIKKIRYGHFRSKKMSKKGGLGCENFIRCLVGEIEKLSLALYQEITSLGMKIFLQSLTLVSKIA